MKKNILNIILFFLFSTTLLFAQSLADVIKADTIFLSDIGESFIKKNDTSAAYHLPCSSYIYVFGSKQYLYFTSCKFKDEVKPIKKIISVKRLKESIVIDSNFIEKNGIKFWKSKLLSKKTFFLLHKSSDINEFTIEEVFYVGTSIPESGKDYVVDYIGDNEEQICYDSKFFKLVFDYLYSVKNKSPKKITFDFNLNSKILDTKKMITYFNVNEYLENIFKNIREYKVCNLVLQMANDLEKKYSQNIQNDFILYRFSKPLRLRNNKFLIFYEKQDYLNSIIYSSEKMLFVIEASSSSNFLVKDNLILD